MVTSFLSAAIAKKLMRILLRFPQLLHIYAPVMPSGKQHKFLKISHFMNDCVFASVSERCDSRISLFGRQVLL